MMRELVAAKNAARANAAREFLPARLVWERYSVTQMTLWRWLHDLEMGFPKPTYLGRFRYWRVRDLEAWEAAQARPAGDEAA
jgi:predicted DNA-binding transcriptional regulator AlpA